MTAVAELCQSSLIATAIRFGEMREPIPAQPG